MRVFPQMILRCLVLLLVLCAMACQGTSQNRIVVSIPTVEAETASIWRTIRDIQFLEGLQYEISLPGGAYIATLVQKAKGGELADEDFEQLGQFVRDSVYQAAAYQQGYERIVSNRELINQQIKRITNMSRDWEFTEFNTYEISLTLYGTGGSYDPEAGTILMYTTPQGEFKQYENPTNTIIHEIVHIGIEQSIIQAFDVPHPLKERIVDTFVYLTCGEYLPDYRIQEMGENRIDSYLQTAGDLKRLDSIVAEIMEKE